MNTNPLEDLITEVLMYLQNSNINHIYDKIIDRVFNLKLDKHTQIVIDECTDLRENVITFQIRETQKRVGEINKLINEIRFCNESRTYEINCLDSIYHQFKQVNERLCLLYKLDYLLLTISNTNITTK